MAWEAASGVLWCAIAKLLKSNEDVHYSGADPRCEPEDIIIFTLADSSERGAAPPDADQSVSDCHEAMFARIRAQFGLEFSDAERRRIRFVGCRAFRFAEARYFPVLTILGQSLASMVVAAEAMLRFYLLRRAAGLDSGVVPPRVFIDTTGFAFSLPVAKVLSLWRTRTAAYVHYPTMSEDMLTRVRDGSVNYNNSATVARSAVLTFLKSAYYRAFLILYGLCGGLGGDLVWANSKWTRARVQRVFGLFGWLGASSPPGEEEGSSGRGGVNVKLLYPPTDIAAFTNWCSRSAGAAASSSTGATTRSSDVIVDRDAAKKQMATRDNVIVSLAQFRIEKDHERQVRAFAEAQTRGLLPAGARLEMMGSTRGPTDEALVSSLRALISELGVGDSVSIHTNLPLASVLSRLTRAKAAVHTMRDEHLGISLIEFVASGLIVVAHRSGGPRDDILTSEFQSAFLCVEVGEFADAMGRALSCYDEKLEQILDEVSVLETKFVSNDRFGVLFRDAIVALASEGKHSVHESSPLKEPKKTS